MGAPIKRAHAVRPYIYGMQLPNRQSVRLQHYDYGSTGAYFVTVCTHLRVHALGEIQNGTMCLSPLGAKVWEEWLTTFIKRPAFSPGAFIVMPNHWHGIIHISRPAGEHWDENRIEAFGPSKKDTLATMMKGMQSAITSFARRELDWEGKLWQRGYHEHVIRDDQDYDRIETYILDNTRRWKDDCFNK